MLPVPALRGGAIPRMWEGLAREFARAGHATCVFARDYRSQAREETVDGVRYVRWGGFDQGRLVAIDLAKDFLYAARAARRLPAADILVTNDFWLPVLARSSRADAGKIVVNANRFPKRQYFLYRRVARIAAASSAVRDAILAQTPGLGERVQVFPNPVDLGIMRPPGPRRPDVPRILLYAGRLHPEKGVHLLAEAFTQVSLRNPAWRLRILGPWRAAEGGGGEAYLRRLQALLHGAAADLVEPKFEAEALAAEYRAASLFCYPSVADAGESFGLAALESMACGVAPVVSALACFRDFVVEGENGWIFDHRAAEPVRALAHALEGAMADPERLRAAGQRAVETARRFGYAEVAGRYLQDFHSLLASPAAHA